MTTDSADRRRWIALGLLATAQFVVVLDASIVNVALPSIGKSLHFSQDSLSWVVNAYVLTFGGFLLLGGRLAVSRCKERQHSEPQNNAPQPCGDSPRTGERLPGCIARMGAVHAGKLRIA